MIANYHQTIFMTGATGFLGHYVLKNLVNEGFRMVVMLRPPLADSVARLKELLNRLGGDLESYIQHGQIVPVEGILPNALPRSDWGRTDAVLNCAASLQLFSNGNADPEKTNVGGTEAMIEWAETNSVKTFHAVSTAYTCGWNRGLIKEAFHHPKPDFQTDYEKSKWLAEMKLEEWAQRGGRVLTIYRPSFLVGDSTTGYTTQFGGMYQLAWLVSLLKKQYADSGNGEKTYVSLRIPGNPDDPQNLVPVDFVARVMGKVISNSALHNRIYHLANPEPPTNDLFKKCCEDYFGLYGGYFVEPDKVIGKCSSAESLLWDQYHLLTPRVTHNPVFDMTNTLQVMEQNGITFPTLDHDRIIKLFKYASECGWRPGLNKKG